MATITASTWTGDGVNNPAVSTAVEFAYKISREISIADLITLKGSALAQDDVVKVLNIPADTAVIGAWAQKTLAMTGTSTDLTFDIGITGGDVDVYVDGWDFDGAAVGSYATPQGVMTPMTVFTTAGTIDILFTTQTGTVLTGKVVVSALCVDLKKAVRPGIAQLQS